MSLSQVSLGFASLCGVFLQMLVRHIVRLLLVLSTFVLGGCSVAIGRYRWFAWAIVVGIGVAVFNVHGMWTEVA